MVLRRLLAYRVELEPVVREEDPGGFNMANWLVYCCLVSMVFYTSLRTSVFQRNGRRKIICDNRR
jgi:hypothetical protein